MILLPLNTTSINDLGITDVKEEFKETFRSSQSSNQDATINEDEVVTTINSIPSQAKKSEMVHGKMNHVGKMDIMHVPKFKKCDKYKKMTICWYEEPVKDPFPEFGETITEKEPFQILNSEKEIENNISLLAQINEGP